jgi:HEAT repeat protein
MKRLALSLLLLTLPAALAVADTQANPADTAAWIEKLQGDDIREQWYATHVLARLGPKAADAVEPLRKILADQYAYEYVRGGAACALGRIGPAAEPAVPLLVSTLASKQVSVRRNSSLALLRIGGVPREAAEKLVPRLRDPDEVVRANAAAALWKLAEDPRAMDTLKSMLQAKGPGAYEAAVALGRLAPEAKPAIPLLVAALASDDADAARAAARSLGRFGKSAIEPLEPAIAAAEPTTALRAVEALGQIGPAGEAALIKSLKHPNPLVRRGVARELGRLGPAGKNSAAALLTAASDKDADVRETAAAALRKGKGKE